MPLQEVQEHEEPNQSLKSRKKIFRRKIYLDIVSIFYPLRSPFLLNISDTNIQESRKEKREEQFIPFYENKVQVQSFMFWSDRIGFKLFFFSYRQGNLEKSMFIIGIDVTIFTKLFSWYLETKCYIKVNISLWQACLVYVEQTKKFEIMTVWVKVWGIPYWTDFWTIPKL